MKKQDVIFFFGLVVFFSPFIFSEQVYETYREFNKEHGLIMSFVKFAVLATLGESIGLRIASGVYNKTGFGILPKTVIWGIFGLTIKIALIIFSFGTIKFLNYTGVSQASDIMAGGLSLAKIGIAFCISFTLNLIYAPWLMTFHKITDMHIAKHGGSLLTLLKPINFEKAFSNLDWKVQWGFVFKKTIPLFWLPAHTITFLLAPEQQILYAAILGIVLGVILAFAIARGKK